jgi:hypothetical protein
MCDTLSLHDALPICLTVNISKPREDRPARSGGGGGYRDRSY